MAILGESFKPWVIKQIETRQDKLSARNKDIDLLKYLTSRTAFLRLTSGVDVAENLLDYYKQYLPEGFITNVKGNELARQYVLEAARFRPPGNTIDDPLQFTSGVGYNNTNKSSYGFLSDSNYGLVPPPGITMANVKSLNRGTIREASIQIVCHNLYQLIVINILFLKLKYSLLLEWGHTVYYDNNGNLMQDYDIPNLSPSFLDGEFDQISLLKTIALKRQQSCGNYDAFFGLVKNFEWQAEENGSYTITISAISTGDVIESLKINTDFTPDVSGTEAAFKKSTLHKILGETQKFIKASSGGYVHGYNDGTDIKRLNTEYFAKNAGGIVKGGYNYRNYNDNDILDQNILNTTGSSMLTEKEGFKTTFPNLQVTNTTSGKAVVSDQYYIKLGTFLRLMESFALFYDTKKKIVTEDGQDLGSPPMFFLDHDFDKHECLTLPDHTTVDPTIALIPLEEPTVKTTETIKGFAHIKYPISSKQGVYNYQEVDDNGNKTYNPTPDSTSTSVSYNKNQKLVIENFTTEEEGANRLGFKLGDLWVSNVDSDLRWEQPSGIPKIFNDKISSLFNASVGTTTGAKTTAPWTTYQRQAVSAAPTLKIPIYVDTSISRNTSAPVKAGTPGDDQYTPSPGIVNGAMVNHFTTFDGKIESGNSGALKGISLKFRTENPYIGKTMHIYVNLEHIVKVLDDNIEDDGSVPLLPFLNQLLADISTALGSINNFDVDYDDETNTFSVVDSAVVPLKYGKEYSSIAKFNINALNPNGVSGKNKDILGAGGSFVTNFSLKSEIFSSIGNAIALGAQQNGNQPGSNSTGISKMNEGIIDRLMTEKKNRLIVLEPSASFLHDSRVKSQFTNYLIKLRSQEKGLGLTVEDIDFYRSYVVDVYQHDLGVLTNSTGSYVPGTGFIPLNLQLTMDGLSGLVQYQTFEISENLLPPEYYSKLRFITTTIEHKISSDKGWETTISTLGVPKTKINLDQAVEYQSNISGSKSEIPSLGNQTAVYQFGDPPADNTVVDVSETKDDKELSLLRKTIIRIAKEYYNTQPQIKEIFQDRGWPNNPSFENEMKTIAHYPESLGQAWCNYFVRLIYKKAYLEVGAKDNEIKKIYEGPQKGFAPWNAPMYTNVNGTAERYYKLGYAELYKPGVTKVKPGDAFIYRWSGGTVNSLVGIEKNELLDHINIVIDVDKNGNFSTIGGNESSPGNVMNRTYNKNNKVIKVVVRPIEKL